MTTSTLSLDILICWLNTLTPPSCLLVSELPDLLSGHAVFDLLQHYFPSFCHSVPENTPVLRLAWCCATLCSIAESQPASKIGSLPSLLRRRDAPQLLQQGDSASWVFFLSYIRFLMGGGPRPMESGGTATTTTTTTGSSSNKRNSSAASPRPVPMDDHDKRSTKPTAVVSVDLNAHPSSSSRAHSADRYMHVAPRPATTPIRGSSNRTPTPTSKRPTSSTITTTTTTTTTNTMTHRHVSQERTPVHRVAAAGTPSGAPSFGTFTPTNARPRTTTPVQSIRRPSPAAMSSMMMMMTGDSSAHHHTSKVQTVVERSSSRHAAPIKSLQYSDAFARKDGGGSAKKNRKHGTSGSPSKPIASFGDRTVGFHGSTTPRKGSPLRSSSTSRSPSRYRTDGLSSARQKSATPLSALQKALLVWAAAFAPSMTSWVNMTVETLQTHFVTGVALCELVSTVLREPLQGIHRTASKTGSRMANLNRALQALRSVRKMNPRYLFSADRLCEGDVEVFFGLLHDIRKVFPGSVASSSSSAGAGAGAAAGTSTPGHATMSSAHNVVNSATAAKFADLQSSKSGVQLSAASGMFSSQQQSTSSSASMQQSSIAEINKAIKALGYNWRDDVATLFEHPLRNGTVLCSLLDLVPPHRHPRSVAAVKQNFECGLGLLRDSYDLASHIVWDVESLLRGLDQNLYSLYKACLDVRASKLATTGAPSHDVRYDRLLQFLYDIGVAPRFWTVDDCLSRIRNGTLLCTLAEKLCRVKLTGVFLSPRVEATQKANIRKACVTLMGIRGMSMQWCNSEEAIVHDDREAILGLMSDIMTAVGYQPHAAPSSAYNQNVSSGGANSQSAAHAASLAKISGVIPTELNPQVPVPVRALEGQIMVPEMFVPSNPHVAQKPSHNLQRSSDQTPGSSSMSQASQGYLLGKWLHSLGITLTNPFVLEGTSISEFRNGVLLCKLATTLEHVDISFTAQPKSNAACLFNIRKALEVFRKKKNMPLDYLWSEAEILEGRGDIIRGLLEQVRRAYGQRWSSVERNASARRQSETLQSSRDGERLTGR